MDFAVPQDTPIVDPLGGVVRQSERTNWGDGTTSGGLVSIKSFIPGLGDETEYFLHLDSIAPGITPGQVTMPNQVIGYSGGQTSGGNWPTSTKYSTGPHLEYGFDAPFVGGPGSNINPLPVIRDLQQGKPIGNILQAPSQNTVSAVQNNLNVTNAQIASSVTGLQTYIQSLVTGLSTTLQTDMVKILMTLVGCGLLIGGVYLASNTNG